MKIKLTFTDEHIALIKALNFERIDVDAIVRSFEQYNEKVKIISDVEDMCQTIRHKVIRDAKNITTVQKLLKQGKLDEETAMNYPTHNYDAIVRNHIQECALGDIFDKYRITIDSLYGFDNFNLWGGTYIWEQMAYILGIYNHVIKGTEEDPTGPKFPEEDMEHMKDLDAFILTHLEHIFQILLQFCTEGIQPGVTYWCYDYEKIWHKE